MSFTSNQTKKKKREIVQIVTPSEDETT